MANGESNDEGTGRSKNRSPEHPAISLREAIDLASTVMKDEGFNFAPYQTLLKSWGYSPKSSTGQRKIAALIHYGLAEDEGSGGDRRVRLTPLAKRILRARHEERQDRAAIQEAALRPSIYQKLWDAWGQEDRLPSRASMEFQLRNDWHFNPTAVSGFIDDFEDTLEFAGLDKEGGNNDVQGQGMPPLPLESTDNSTGSGGSADTDPKEALDMAEAGTGATHAPSTRGEPKNLTIPIPGGLAILQAPWPPSPDIIEAIGDWLEYVGKVYGVKKRDDKPTD